MLLDVPRSDWPHVDHAGERYEQGQIDQAVAIARELAVEASQHAVKRRTARATALLRSPQAVAFLSAVTDEVIRIPDAARAARRFREVVTQSLPAKKGREGGLGHADRALLQVGARVAPLAPALVMPLVRSRLRMETRDLIVDSGRGLAAHLAGVRQAGNQANVNGLGEAIVGPAEAEARFAKVLNLIARDDVTYVSVKLSAVVDNLSALAFDRSVERAVERLRTLYATAQAHHVFVNLDMEEYRDLELTVKAFTAVLSEPAFRAFNAGIVLQTYLPDSARVARELGAWAAARVRDGGAPIKVRIVKGANLAMEAVEAELRGWALAPFPSKELVDANYKHVLDVLADQAFDDAVRIGLASHNLFDVAWGLVVQRELAKRDQHARLEFEMLQGMAPAQAAALTKRAGKVLLYTPVVGNDDFVAAIAYLVRRLDENTSPENFLAHLATIATDPAEFGAQEIRFRNAVVGRTSIDERPRRTQNRNEVARPNDLDTPFTNEPDTDFALPKNREWIHDGLAQTPSRASSMPIALMSSEDVEHIVRIAKSARTTWSNTPVRERSLIINRIGDVVAARRGDILALMAHTAQKTVAEGDPEVSEAVDFCRYYAREAIRIEAEGDSHALGTVLVTPPWNFPYAIALGGVTAALAAGNTVILKPAPQVVQVQSLVAEHCWAAGVPRDVLQLAVVEDGPVGQQLITHEHVDAVILTGAYETAKMFLEWRPSLKLFAETSGKNAMVITATADVDQALKDLVKSAFGHSGQKCSAASLAIVEAALYDDSHFRSRLADAVASLRCGPATDLSTDVAPLIEAPSDKLVRALTILDDGEEWLVQPREQGPHHWSPGVRIGVQPGSWFARTECFGPVLGVVRADSLSQAIAIQNGSNFGLTAGLHALDPEEIAAWTSKVEVGNAYVNRSTTGAIVQRQPFGGWKRSSVGATAKAGGPEYVSQFRRWPSRTSHTASNAGSGLNAGLERELKTAERFATWWESVGSQPHDRSGLASESNQYRLHALPDSILVRVLPGVSSVDVGIALAAAATVGATVVLSFADVESVSQCVARVSDPSVVWSRLRVLGVPEPGEPSSEHGVHGVHGADVHGGDGVLGADVHGGELDALLRAAHAHDVSVDLRPATGVASIELPRWCRAKAVSQTLHRHGHIRNHP